MANDLKFSYEDLLENPTSRVPVVLCLDTSTSMAGDPIRELADGVELFYQSVFDHEIARFSAEIAVVTFGCDGVRRAVDFGPVDEPPQLDFRAGGNTPMGRGVGEALDMLEERKQAYRSAGVDYFQPWMVLMTDGAPTDSIDRTIGRVVKLVESKRLTVFPIGIGEDADMEILAQFHPGRTPLRLRGLEFKRFFEWLSASVQRVSASIPGQDVPLDVEAIKGWATV